jgi:hypothetical protein
MATYLENLQTARDRLAASLAENAGRPNYSVDGETFTFGELVDRLAKLDAAIAAGQGPMEVRSEMF